MRRLVVLALAACNADVSVPVDAACNPLGATGCLTPWPSAAFEIEDATTATGRRLALPAEALPGADDDHPIDPARWNAADGFSAATPIVVAFPDGVSPDGLPSADNMGLSVAIDSPTVILDLTTGARVAHHAELDAQALVLHPAARLAPGHRYAVAITSRARAADGDDLPSPIGFEALRDGKPTDHALLEAMRPRYDDVLDALDEAGVPEDELVVAWDFTVASTASRTAELAAARDRALAARIAPRPEVTREVTRIERRAGARVVHAAIDVPQIAPLVRDAAGLPLVRGSRRIEVTAIVPACGGRARPIVVYGRTALDPAGAPRALDALADALCMTIVAIEPRGGAAARRALHELAAGDELTGALLQTVIDHVALVGALRGPLAPIVRGDATRIAYLGVDAGALLGPAIVVHADLARGALLGPAHPVRAFASLGAEAAVHARYPDPLDATLARALNAARLDAFDVTPDARGDAAHLLLQVTLGDEVAPNVASYWQARSLGVPVLGPSPTTPWGLTVRDGPVAGSALVILDGGAPRGAADSVPAPAPGMHALALRTPAALRQLRRFFERGQIAQTCAGACYCATGACD